MLSEICRSVTLIHRRDAFSAEGSLVEDVKARENIRIVYSTVLTALHGDERLSGIALKNTESGEESVLPVTAAFVAIGQVPENDPFVGVAELDERGYLASGEDCLTRTPGIYAAGDCRRKVIRQVTTATADGAVAALAACRYIDSLK